MSLVAVPPDWDRALGDVDPTVPNRAVRNRILGDVLALVLDREVTGSRWNGTREKRCRLKVIVSNVADVG